MKSFATTILIIWCLVFGLASAGCNHSKAMATVRDAQNKAAQTLIYIGKIAKANNDAFAEGDIPSSIHHPINEAARKALQAVNVFVLAINAAKATVASGADPNAQVDILKALFNSTTAQAVISLIGLVATVPPALAQKIGIWATGLQLALDAFRALFAEFQMEVTSNAG